MNQEYLKCFRVNHLKPVQMFCLNKECQEFRLSCFQCYQSNSHIAHPQDNKEISELISFFNEESENYNQMIKEIENQFEKMADSLNLLIDELKQRYQISEQQLKNLNSSEINQAISYLVKYKEENNLSLNSINHSIINLYELIQNNLKQIQLKEVNYQKKIIGEIQPIKFELLQSKSFDEDEIILSLEFNHDLTCLIAGYQNGEIKIYQYNSCQLIFKQALQEHQNSVNCLCSTRQTNGFFSGSDDTKIVFWKQNKNGNWFKNQLLKGHSYPIVCMKLTNKDDMMISANKVGELLFWNLKQLLWICYQTLNIHKEQIRCISLNESQNYLVSCGDDNLINIYKQEKISKQWATIQQIKVDQCGYRLCFIGENKFVFQPRCSAKLAVYQYNINDSKYIKVLEQQVQTSQYCNHLFPQKWVKSQSILLNKAGNYLNLIRVNQNGQFLIEQVIDFGTACFYGTISEDGNYIVTWDYESSQIQIRRNSYLT